MIDALRGSRLAGWWQCVALCATVSGGLAQPTLGQDVFREFTFNYGAKQGEHFSELDPDTKRDFSKEHTWGLNKPRHVPHPITLDLAGATGAELSVEYWGGHIGTSGQRLQVNGQGWVDLPQPAGTPGMPICYHRTLLGNNAVPIPLAQLRDGMNSVQFAAGSQVCYSFDFGFYWIYDFTVRVSYDASKPHPAGVIVSPKPGAAFGDTLELEATASSPNGPIARVEFIGEYDDFDWDGDGVWREWQFQTRHGVLHHHLGTATSAPWRVTANTAWWPDQTQPTKVRARITDATGMTFLTPPVENLTQRRGRSVQSFKSADVPEKFSARAKRRAGCTIELPASLEGVTAVRLVLSTWSANTDEECVHELLLNGERLANRFGQFHDYSFDSLEVPVARLKPGKNELTLYSEFMGHMLEVNWPGPVLLLERSGQK